MHADILFMPINVDDDDDDDDVFMHPSFQTHYANRICQVFVQLMFSSVFQECLPSVKLEN